MNKFNKTLISGAAAAAVMLQTALPAFATTTIEISGNGAGSDNWTDVNQTTTTTVSQNNNANVTNKVDANASTGGNDANFNTGGDVVVHTGDATVKTNVENVLNSNTAEVDCCQAGDTEVKVTGNGAYTDNTVMLNQAQQTAVAQNNNATVKNDVDADAKTGYNDANKNTGGDVTIVTGNAKVETDIATVANTNAVKVGSAHHAGSNVPSASFIISGNGAGSDNYISAALTKVNSVAQNNNANITNDVDADAKTGKNDAGFNTGGDVIIGTGNASVYADVLNDVNFNYADIDCGCTWDILAKIAGNGAEVHHYDDKADNTITLALDSVQAVGQNNDGYLYNDLEDLRAKTGYNDVEANTASDPYSDPAIITGNAVVDSGVQNSGNVNVVGDFGPFDMPQMPNVDFSFNMAALWMMFGMHS